MLRAIGRGLAALVGLLIILGLVGASYEAIAARGDAQRYPAPGQLIDVGGYRLHIQCVGAGSPTVVLDAGLGGSSLDWNLVQPELARTTRVCAYDRTCRSEGARSRAPRARSPTSRRAAVDQCRRCGRPHAGGTLTWWQECAAICALAPRGGRRNSAGRRAG